MFQGKLAAFQTKFVYPLKLMEVSLQHFQIQITNIYITIRFYIAIYLILNFLLTE